MRYPSHVVLLSPALAAFVALLPSVVSAQPGPTLQYLEFLRPAANVGALPACTAGTVNAGRSRVVLDSPPSWYRCPSAGGSWVCVAGGCAPAGGGSSDHGALTGLGDDDHTQYALLAGRAGGQTLLGGTASGENLVLESTANATKGRVDVLDKLMVRSDTASAVVLQIDADSFGSQAGYVRIGKGGDSYGGVEFLDGEVRQVYFLLFPDESLYLGRDGAQRFIVNVPTDFTDGTVRLVPRSSPPVSCGSTTRGSMYYDSDDADFCDCVGAGWRSRGLLGSCS